MKIKMEKVKRLRRMLEGFPRFASLSFFKVCFATWCLAFSRWKMTAIIFFFFQNRPFFINSRFETGELLSVLLRSYFSPAWRRSTWITPLESHQNGKQHLYWMQAPFRHGFWTFTRLFPALFALNVMIKDLFWSKSFDQPLSYSLVVNISHNNITGFLSISFYFCIFFNFSCVKKQIELDKIQ